MTTKKITLKQMIDLEKKEKEKVSTCSIAVVLGFKKLEHKDANMGNNRCGHADAMTSLAEGVKDATVSFDFVDSTSIEI